MRRLTSWLAIVIGTLLLLVGLGTAVYAGPSGTVRLPGGTVADGAPVTVLSDALTSYRDTTLRVTASAGDQRVFIGAAHPVDATSYLAGGRAAVVDQVTTSGLTSHVEGKAGVRPGSPAGLDVWTHRVEGAGEQVLDVPLDGSPVRVVVQTAPEAALTLSVGFAVAGLFPLAVGVAVLGAALVALGVLLLRRSRRPQAGAPVEDADTTDADTTDADTTDADTTDAETADAGITRRAVSRTVRAGSVGVVAAVALGGCVSMPTPVAAPAGPVTKVAMTTQAAGGVLTDYNRRNNAALASLVRKQDVKAWDGVDSGPVLAGDRLGTALEAAQRVKATPTTLTYTPHGVWAPTVTTYPLWFASTTTSKNSADAKRPTTPATGAAKPSEDQLYLAVFQRPTARQPWTMHLDVTLDRAPAPAPASGSATASSADVRRGVELVKDVARWFEGRPAPSVTPGKTVTAVRAALREKVAYGTFAGLTCQPYLTSEQPQASMRVVRTSSGLLTVATLQCQSSYAPLPGHVIGWQPAYAKVLGTTDALGGLWVRTTLVSVAVDSRGAKGTIIGGRSTLARIADLDLR